MDSFYRYNFKAVFLGDGKDAFRKAFALYLDYGIESVFLDEKPRLISRLCPFIRTVSLKNIHKDEFILGMLDSVVERDTNATHLLFTHPEKFKGFYLRCEGELENHFILHPDIVLNDM